MSSSAFANGDATMRVTERIESAMPNLPAAMRKVAELVIADPRAALEYSITELAEHAGTSPATITRFCRAIGYPGYVQFRVGVAADSGRIDDGASVEIGRAFAPTDSPREVMTMLLNGHVRSLKATAGLLDLSACARVAAQIAQASHVDIYGVGGSGAMAEEMQDRLYRIGINVHSWRDVHEGLASATLQGPGTVALGISHSGETRETIDMLACASQAGALTVAVSNNTSTPLSDVADLTLVAAVPAKYLHPADLSAKHAQLFVLDLLYLLVAGVDYEDSLTKLTDSAMAVVARRHLARSRTSRRVQ